MLGVGVRYLDFYQQFKQFEVIRLGDIKLIEPNFDHKRLVEWQQKGYLVQLRRGHYILADQVKSLSEEGLFLIANKIYSPSYVSLETAFHYYNFIPEAPFTITSISSRKTEQFATPIGNFSYRSVKSDLMQGYKLINVETGQQSTNNGHSFEQSAKLAYPEKAILDYLYLNSKINDIDALASLRLNREEIKSRCNFERFEQLLSIYSNKALRQRAEVFVGWTQQR
jgi:hypothetical protein